VFEGSLVALVTPFDAEDRVDYGALEKLIEFHVRSGTDGLVIAGTTGESPTLRKDEHATLIRRAAEIAAGRLPVIAGTGSNSTSQTIELSLAIADAAIDAYLLVVPYYNKPVQEGIFQHFTAIGNAVDKPIMLYNVPGRTVADLMPETLARLSQHPRIFGVKDATGSIDRLKECQKLVEADFCFYSGDDFTVLDFMLEGGSGVVSVSANIAPRQMAGLCEAALAGNADAARLIDERLQPLNASLFIQSNPIPVTWALTEMELIGPGIRLPLTGFSIEYHEQMRTAMQYAGIGAE
jgi:4-hydroxy-tetrahydrodipicolinate synthase